jgi:hypothetical protein
VLGRAGSAGCPAAGPDQLVRNPGECPAAAHPVAALPGERRPQVVRQESHQRKPPPATPPAHSRDAHPADQASTPPKAHPTGPTEYCQHDYPAVLPQPEHHQQEQKSPSVARLDPPAYSRHDRSAAPTQPALHQREHHPQEHRSTAQPDPPEYPAYPRHDRSAAPIRPAPHQQEHHPQEHQSAAQTVPPEQPTACSQHDSPAAPTQLESHQQEEENQSVARRTGPKARSRGETRTDLASGRPADVCPTARTVCSTGVTPTVPASNWVEWPENEARCRPVWTRPARSAGSTTVPTRSVGWPAGRPVASTTAGSTARRTDCRPRWVCSVRGSRRGCWIVGSRCRSCPRPSVCCLSGRCLVSRRRLVCGCRCCRTPAVGTCPGRCRTPAPWRRSTGPCCGPSAPCP